MPQKNVKLGEGVQIFLPDLVNLYGCTIGEGTKVGTFVEIQKNATIGARCKISSRTFICEGMTIEDEVVIGHGMMFTNDRLPRATASGGALQTEKDWVVIPTVVKKGASIGSGAMILVVSPSANEPWSAPARWSPKTSRPTRWWRAYRQTHGQGRGPRVSLSRLPFQGTDLTRHPPQGPKTARQKSTMRA